MSPPSLYKICIKKTCEFLGSGVWKACEQNPLSSLPSSVFHNLMDSMLPPSLPPYSPYESHFQCYLVRPGAGNDVDDYHLLLTSGLLKHLNLFDCPHYLDMKKLLQKLSFGCQNLQTLLLPRTWPESDDMTEALETLLRRSPHLEELYSSICFDPSNLKNCKKLRTLRFRLVSGTVQKFCLKFSPEHLKCLESLEVFSVCCPVGITPTVPYISRENVWNTAFITLASMVLDNCPKLTSLGCLESSFAVGYRPVGHGTDSAPCHSFQLRECFWGMRIPEGSSFSSITRPREGSVPFPDMIRCAVLSLPLVETLRMDVFHKDSLQPLTGLKNLVSLDIGFDSCAGACQPEFYSLLDGIGPSLKHLSIRSKDKFTSFTYATLEFNLNTIFDKCPTLESLKLHCYTNVDRSVKPHVNHLPLKHLFVRSLRAESESLLFLLTSCMQLKTLFLQRSLVLEDGTLSTILKKNPLAELEEVYIGGCSLSKRGLRELIQSSRMLRKLHFRSSLVADADVREYVAKLNPEVTCYNKWDSEISGKQFCQYKCNWCAV